MPETEKLPQIIDVFEEMDIAEVGDVHTLGAIYWSFPADGRQGFEADISAAAASSYTVESQRGQVAKFAAWSGLEVVNEVALQFDLSLGLDDQQRGRLTEFLALKHDASVIVAHDALNRWRPAAQE